MRADLRWIISPAMVSPPPCGGHTRIEHTLAHSLLRLVMISSLRSCAFHRGDYAAEPNSSGNRGQPGNWERNCAGVGAEQVPRCCELPQRIGVCGGCDRG